MNKILNKQIICENYIDSKDSIINYLQSFLFNFSGNTYVISIHHFLPFKKKNISLFCNDKRYECNILLRSSWNELMIIDSTDELNNNCYIFKNYKLQIPNFDKKIYYTDSNMKELIIIGKKYYNVGMIDGYPRIVYYKMKCIKGCIDRQQSGSPVYDDKNKLIGIIEKTSEEYTLVLPIIYLIKTLEKKDNSNIFWISENINNIKKISNYILKNNELYFKAFGKIPFDVYFLLEGDSNKYEKITLKNDKIRKINYVSVTENMKIKLENCLIFKNNKYKINICLIKLIKIIESNKKAKLIIDSLNENKNISIDENFNISFL